MAYNIAVVGATGNVGREMLNILFERRFPIKRIVALASRKSMGTECSFGDDILKTKDLDTFDFEGFDIALFAIGADATKKYAKKATEKNCFVIDNSSLYRYHPDIPLIVPEVNPADINQINSHYARWRLPSDVNFIRVKPYTDINLDDNSINVISLITVMEHLPDPLKVVKNLKDYLIFIKIKKVVNRI